LLVLDHPQHCLPRKLSFAAPSSAHRASAAARARGLGRAILPLDHRSIMVLTLQLMDGGKEALEKFAREAVALYGRDAPEMLLHRAELAHLYGDPLAATWHEVAAIAARIT